MVVQSGPRVFASLLTAQSPGTIDFNALNDGQNAAINNRVASGRTFQQASRIEAQITAERYHIAYYQGMAGVLTRVSPR